MSITDIVTSVVSQIEDDLDSQAQALVSEMQTVGGRIGEIEGECASRFSEVQSQAQNFMTQVESAESTMGDVTGQLQSRAESLRESLGNSAEEGNSFFESCQGIVETLDQGVQALVPDADEVMEAVQQTIDTLSTEVQSLDEALEATRLITDQHLHNPFADLITNLNSEVENRSSAWGQYVTQDFLPAAANQIAEFKSHVDQVVEQGRDKLSEVKDTIETEGNSAIESLEGMFGDTFGGLIDTAQTLANVMQQIGSALESTSEVVGTTTQVMSAGTNMTGIGAKSVINIIEGIVDIFSSVM